MNKIKKELSTFFTLLKLELSRIRTSSKQNDGKKRKSKLASIAIMILVSVYVAFIGYQLAKGGIAQFRQMNMLDGFIKVLIMSMFCFNFFVTLSSVTMVVSNNKTNNFLNTLPISSQKRFSAVILSHLVNGYTINLLYGIVPLIYFGVESSGNVWYYLSLILGFILLPILTILVMYTLTLILINILSVIFSKKIIRYINYLYFAVFMGIYFKINSELTSNSTAFLGKTLELSKSSPIFWYPNKIAEIIIGQDRAINILKIIGIDLGVFILMYFTLGKIYLKQLLRLDELDNNKGLLVIKVKELFKKGNKNSEIETKEQYSKTYIKGIGKIQKRKVQKQLRRREWAFFKKEPEVALGTIYAGIFIPFLVVVSVLFQFNSDYNQAKKANYVYIIQNKVENETNKDENSKEKDKLEYRLLTDAEIERKNIKIDEKKDHIIKFKVADMKLPSLEKEIKKIENDNKTEEKNNAKTDRLRDDFNELEMKYNSKNFFDYILKIGKKALKEDDGAAKELAKQSGVYFLPVAIAVSLTIFTYISIYLVSKDKDERAYLKIIPIPFEQQFKAKKRFAMNVKLIYFAMYLCVSLIFTKLHVFKNPYYILGLITGIVILSVNEQAQLLIDYFHPNFNWKTPQNLIKKSVKGIVYSVVQMILIGIVALIMIYFKSKQGFKIEYMIYGISAVSLFAYILIQILIKKNKNKIMLKLGD